MQRAKNEFTNNKCSETETTAPQENQKNVAEETHKHTVNKRQTWQPAT